MADVVAHAASDGEAGPRFARWGAAMLVVVDVVVAAGAPLWDQYFTKSDAALQVGAAVIAVATFLGVWLLQRHAGAGRSDRNSMRDGIAAAFVVTYLVIAGWAAFLITSEGRHLSALAENVVPNFTVLTGIVIGGYFGADAVKQVTLINAQRRDQASEVGRDSSSA
ncbi:hypothetical protein [Mycobacterium sp. 4858]|uniref:hypothetical protein n=1 Tax=Mycobacterium sp. 4858 TaxID=2057185 RepID=UPI000C83F65D|nr:hypothetical protein [Mycobacterium sp. 4858]